MQHQQQTQWCWAATSVSAAHFYRRPWTSSWTQLVTGRSRDWDTVDIGQLGTNVTAATPPHEVFNNIIEVQDGRPLSRDFRVYTENEVYDGNCLWSHGQWAAANGPYRFVHVDGEGDVITTKSVQDLRESRAFARSKLFYEPGWDASTIEEDPLLDDDYVPEEPMALDGSVDLRERRWPGMSDYRPRRGATLSASFAPPPIRVPVPDVRHMFPEAAVDVLDAAARHRIRHDSAAVCVMVRPSASGEAPPTCGPRRACGGYAPDNFSSEPRLWVGANDFGWDGGHAPAGIHADGCCGDRRCAGRGL